MSISDIAEAHGVSRATVHTYRRGGTFPSPVQEAGTTRLRYRADEVAAWFQANPKRQGKRTDLTEKPQQGDQPMNEEPLHLAEDETPMRVGYSYGANGVGVHDDLIAAVLETWASISPSGDPAVTLRSVNDGAINKVDNLARLAVEAVLQRLADAESSDG